MLQRESIAPDNILKKLKHCSTIISCWDIHWTMHLTFQQVHTPWISQYVISQHANALSAFAADGMANKVVMISWYLINANLWSNTIWIILLSSLLWRPAWDVQWSSEPVFLDVHMSVCYMIGVSYDDIYRQYKYWHGKNKLCYYKNM